MLHDLFVEIYRGLNTIPKAKPGSISKGKVAKKPITENQAPIRENHIMFSGPNMGALAIS